LGSEPGGEKLAEPPKTALPSVGSAVALDGGIDDDRSPTGRLSVPASSGTLKRRGPPGMGMAAVGGRGLPCGAHAKHTVAAG